MRLESAMYASREGITAHGQSISVIGDNIANSNTTAYKEARAEFSNILADSGDNQQNISTAISGSGVEVSRVRQLFTDGAVESTGRELDAAIAGNGFFSVGDPAAPQFTRNGTFSVSAEGLLVDSDGRNVLGVAPGGTALGTIDMVNLPQAGTATGNLAVFGNVGSGADVVANVPANPATFNEVSGAATFSANASVFDSLGESHNVSLYFFKTDANTWTVQSYTDGSEVGGEAGVPSPLGEATLTFGADGRIAEANGAAAQIAAAPAWANGAAAGAFAIDLSGFTQFAGASSLTSITQDGVGIGNIEGYSILEDGTIQANLSSGAGTAIATLQLALFNNRDGLERGSGGVYSATAESGAANQTTVGTDGAGTIVGGALERSNVDTAREFTNLVVQQRGYQANSRILSSADELLRDTLGLMR